jgi:putative hydrolase of the HAD superfamily
VSARAVLLDALGTLVELEPPAPQLRAALERAFGVRVSEAEAERAIAAEIVYYRAHLDEGCDADSVAALRRRCAATLRAALPERARAHLGDLDALTEVLLASLRFSAYEDARAALPELRRGGRRLVVVSNWDFSLGEVLERVGLRGLVDAVLTSAQVGARKPEPEIFAQALAVAGVPAAAAIHVGDSLEEDVAGARGAGIEAVLVVRNGTSGDFGVRTIARLTELDP